MNLYLVSYDLMTKVQNYPLIIGRLTQYGALRVLDSLWIVRSPAAVGAVRDDLAKYIDPNDRLFVATLSGESAWLAARLKSPDAVVKAFIQGA